MAGIGEFYQNVTFHCHSKLDSSKKLLSEGSICVYAHILSVTCYLFIGTH